MAYETVKLPRHGGESVGLMGVLKESKSLGVPPMLVTLAVGCLGTT